MARSIHEIGTERHGARWFFSNERAASGWTAAGTKLKTWNKDVAKALPLAVLYVLDAERVTAGEKWNFEKKCWEKQ